MRLRCGEPARGFASARGPGVHGGVAGYVGVADTARSEDLQRAQRDHEHHDQCDHDKSHSLSPSFRVLRSAMSFRGPASRDGFTVRYRKCSAACVGEARDCRAWCAATCIRRVVRRDLRAARRHRVCIPSVTRRVEKPLGASHGPRPVAGRQRRNGSV